MEKCLLMQACAEFYEDKELKEFVNLAKDKWDKLLGESEEGQACLRDNRKRCEAIVKRLKEENSRRRYLWIFSFVCLAVEDEVKKPFFNITETYQRLMSGLEIKAI